MAHRILDRSDKQLNQLLLSGWLDSEHVYEDDRLVAHSAVSEIVRPARHLFQALRRYRSVDEFPRVRSIEPSYLNTLSKARIKVVQIDAVLAAWLGDKWFPMRDASAGLATHIAQRLVAPDVLGRILRVSFYPNRSELVVRPKSTKTPAERTVALGGLFRRRGQRETDCTAVT